MIENDCVIFVRDPKVVRGGKRLFAQIMKCETRHAHEGARYVHTPALERQFLRRSGMSAG